MFINGILANIKLIGLIALSVACVFFIIKYTQTKSKLLHEVNVKIQLTNDTALYMSRIRGLQVDTTLLREALREVGVKISEVINDDIKKNPTLVSEYPSIEDIKKRRK